MIYDNNYCLNNLNYLIKQAKEGKSEAIEELILIYSEDNDYKDINKAIYYGKMALTVNATSGIYNLGLIYRDLGMYKEAFLCYKKVWEAGELDSGINLGLCYLTGTGTTKNIETAKVIFQKIIADFSKGNFPVTLESAKYWYSIICLLSDSDNKNIHEIRQNLIESNVDNDNSSANDLLIILGK